MIQQLPWGCCRCLLVESSNEYIIYLYFRHHNDLTITVGYCSKEKPSQLALFQMMIIVWLSDMDLSKHGGYLDSLVYQFPMCSPSILPWNSDNLRAPMGTVRCTRIGPRTNLAWVVWYSLAFCHFDRGLPIGDGITMVNFSPPFLAPHGLATMMSIILAVMTVILTTGFWWYIDSFHGIISHLYTWGAPPCIY